MHIYGPGDGIPRGSITDKPYISKRLREDNIDVKWIKDNTKLFGGYWKIYKKKSKIR